MCVGGTGDYRSLVCVHIQNVLGVWEPGSVTLSHSCEEASEGALEGLVSAECREDVDSTSCSPPSTMAPSTRIVLTSRFVSSITIYEEVC